MFPTKENSFQKKIANTLSHEELVAFLAHFTTSPCVEIMIIKVL